MTNTTFCKEGAYNQKSNKTQDLRKLQGKYNIYSGFEVQGLFLIHYEFIQVINTKVYFFLQNHWLKRKKILSLQTLKWWM
jgi:hypothetical protein